MSIKFDLEGIRDALLPRFIDLDEAAENAEPLFCLWRYEQRNGKTTKVPYSVTNKCAESNDSSTFSDLDAVAAAYTAREAAAKEDATLQPYNGIGLGLFNGYSGIDIDDCLDDAGNIIVDAAADIVGRMNTYTEISAGGHGLHLLFRMPPDFVYNDSKYYIKHASNGIKSLECYICGSTNRYLTITGKRFNDSCIRSVAADELTAICDDYMLRQKPKKPKNAADSSAASPLSVQNEPPSEGPSEEAENGKAFADFDKWEAIADNVMMRLEKYLLKDSELLSMMNGKFDTDDESEKDAKLISRLLYWFDNNVDEAISAFIHSQFVRNKDDDHKRKLSRPDYLINTAYNCMPEKSAKEAAQSYKDNSIRSLLKYEYYDSLPSDLTDVGQAMAFMSRSSNSLCYTPSTDWLKYNGYVWQRNTGEERVTAHKMTGIQLKTIENISRLVHFYYCEKGYFDERSAIKQILDKNDIWRLLAVNSEDDDNKTDDECTKILKPLRDFSKSMRQNHSISGMLAEAAAEMTIDFKKLDADAYILNTPKGVIDLRTGEVRANLPWDYCTKSTGVSLNTESDSEAGAKLWNDFLDLFVSVWNVSEEFMSNEEKQERQSMKEYLQLVAGMAAIGEVKNENMIIAYGEGRNGKSTFFNALSKALGDYAGTISADTLVYNKQNKNPEYAKLKGERLVIAAELEEGMKLSTSVLKQIASTDMIHAEPKYLEPFEFNPSHTIILYTNHLPKVGTLDKGTWSRIVILPCRASMPSGNAQIKDYAQYLVDNAGGAILRWICEGAKKLIDNGFNIVEPKTIINAKMKYKQESDWLSDFLTECCVCRSGVSVSSSRLLEVYKKYCQLNGEWQKGRNIFYGALEEKGFYLKHTHTGNVIENLGINSDYSEGYTH